ncbi:MAG: hypothetical protein OER96_10225 [Gammaproteobacteria bacterium]|nr:hypothetical protein [Gammaproteobacteria bacterium]
MTPELYGIVGTAVGAVIGVIGSIWINSQNNKHNLTIHEKQNESQIKALIEERQLNLVEHANEKLGDVIKVGTQPNNAITVYKISPSAADPNLTKYKQTILPALVNVESAMTSANLATQSLLSLGSEGALLENKNVLNTFTNIKQIANSPHDSTNESVEESFSKFVDAVSGFIIELRKVHQNLDIKF